MSSEGGGYPAAPSGSGLTCAAGKDGTLTVNGGDARFTVTSDALDVSWDTVWEGRQKRRVPRASVVSVKVAPDTPSVASRRTAKLQIDFAHGGPVFPLRRRPPEEVEWVAARLREALAPAPPDWSIERPTPPARPGLPAASTTGPRPVKPIGPTTRGPIAPIRNGRVTRRRDSVVIRLRPAAWWATHRESQPMLAIFSLIALFGLACLVLAAGGGPAPTVPLLIFGVVGVVLAFTNVWAMRHIARVAGTSHVLHLSPSGLRVASINRLKLKRQFFPRANLAASAVGETRDQTPTAELHVFFADGTRTELLTGRPVNELNWVAAQLTAALPTVPAKPQAAEPLFQPGGVLPYEPPRGALREIDVRTGDDGGVTIFIPPAPGDRIQAVKWMIPLVILAQVGICVVLGPLARMLGETWPAALFAIVVAAAWVVARIVLQARRGQAPTVIGVDRQFVYADFPNRFRRHKRWPRATVRDVQMVDVAATARGAPARQWVQIVFHDYTPPIELCADHSPADRQRLAAILRAALELPGNP